MRLPSMLLLAALAACAAPSDTAAGDAGPPDAGQPAPTADEACTARSSAQCERLAACSIYELQTRFGDLASCESREKQACRNGLAAPDTGLTVASAGACAVAVPAVACADLLANLLPAACLPQPGRRVAGAVCFNASQCRSGYCGLSKSAGCGTCMDAPGAGAACDVYPCARGLVCAAATTRCTAPGKAGDLCEKGQPCGVALACVGATAGAQGHCEPTGSTVGAACDPKNKTVADCDHVQGLFCVNALCARVAYATGGQACGNVNGVPVACLGEVDCQTPAGSNQGTCVAAASDGAACDATLGPTCRPLARCIPSVAGQTAGSCVFLDAKACP